MLKRLITEGDIRPGEIGVLGLERYIRLRVWRCHAALFKKAGLKTP